MWTIFEVPTQSIERIYENDKEEKVFPTSNWHWNDNIALKSDSESKERDNRDKDRTILRKKTVSNRKCRDINGAPYAFDWIACGSKHQQYDITAGIEISKFSSCRKHAWHISWSQKPS